MPRLTFFDLKTKKKFTTDKFRIETRKGRRFAVAKNPSGGESWRIMGSA